MASMSLHLAQCGLAVCLAPLIMVHRLLIEPYLVMTTVQDQNRRLEVRLADMEQLAQLLRVAEELAGQSQAATTDSLQCSLAEAQVQFRELGRLAAETEAKLAAAEGIIQELHSQRAAAEEAAAAQADAQVRVLPERSTILSSELEGVRLELAEARRRPAAVAPRSSETVAEADVLQQHMQALRQEVSTLALENEELSGQTDQLRHEAEAVREELAVAAINHSGGPAHLPEASRQQAVGAGTPDMTLTPVPGASRQPAVQTNGNYASLATVYEASKQKAGGVRDSFDIPPPVHTLTREVQDMPWAPARQEDGGVQSVTNPAFQLDDTKLQINNVLFEHGGSRNEHEDVARHSSVPAAHSLRNATISETGSQKSLLDTAQHMDQTLYSGHSSEPAPRQQSSSASQKTDVGTQSTRSNDAALRKLQSETAEPPPVSTPTKKEGQSSRIGRHSPGIGRRAVHKAQKLIGSCTHPGRHQS